MKVLVTGANGQLGSAIIELFEKGGIHCIPSDRKHIDITSRESVFEGIKKESPDVVIHTAAYTNVDLAEQNKEQAFLVNATGTKYLAESAEKIGAKFCYISTDYVFNGLSDIPYKELDKTNPINVYGQSKYAGEEYVRSLCSKFYIIRTSWVYGNTGTNFVKTMLRLAEEKSEISVVHDQIGSPTYTVDLAAIIMELIRTSKYGTYHVSNLGTCSWFDFAKAIFSEINAPIKVKPVTSLEFKTTAKRPHYSVLDQTALRENGLPELRPWREALHEFLEEIGAIK